MIHPFRNRIVMVTGGCGFIGSNLLPLLTQCNATVVNLDCRTYAARPPLYVMRPVNLIEEDVDIRDHLAVQRAMQFHKPDVVVHLAAESHVCRSIAGPKAFIETNVMGTFHLLEEFKALKNGGRFVHISTDEVFGECLQGYFDEDSPMLPRNPYAASKASSDHIVRAYNQTYGLPTVTIRMANNFGPNQHSEKLIPRTVRRLLCKEPAVLHGDGSNIREWLFVEDAVDGIIRAMDGGVSGKTYCLNGETEMTNRETIQLVHSTMREVDPAFSLNLSIEHSDGRPTDDRRYAMKGDLAKAELKWEHSAIPFEAKMRKTVRWYMERAIHLRSRRYV